METLSKDDIVAALQNDPVLRIKLVGKYLQTVADQKPINVKDIKEAMLHLHKAVEEIQNPLGL